LAQPINLSIATTQRLDALLATVSLQTAPLRSFVLPEIAVLTSEAPTLPPDAQQQLNGIVQQLNFLLSRPSITAQFGVALVSQFVDFLKGQPALEHQLDLLLRGIPVQTHFFIPFVSALDAAANGQDPASSGAIGQQENFALTQPFISARFLVFLVQEAADNFVDGGPVDISLSGLSDEIRTAGDVNTFRLLAPETGQLTVQMDTTGLDSAGGDDLSGTLSVLDGTGRLVDFTATSTGVGLVGFDVQEGQSYYIQVAGSGASTGRYDLLFALAFGEPSLGSNNSSSANGTAMGLLASELAAADQRGPTVVLLPLSESSLILVATLLSPGVGSPTSADTQPAASRGVLPSGASQSLDDAPGGESRAGLASLVGGLEEALAGSRLLTRDDLPHGKVDPLSVDRLLAAGKELSGEWLPKTLGLGDPRAHDVRLQDLARAVFQVGVEAARQVGRRLPFSWPRETPGPGRPAALDRPLPGPGEEERELPPQDESVPDLPPAESRRGRYRTWEASLAVSVFLLSACQYLSRRTAPADSEGRDTSGSSRAERDRPSGHRWSSRTWDKRYGCNLYCDAGSGCWYYWCPPDDCYYPIDYCPYGKYSWDDQGDSN